MKILVAAIMAALMTATPAAALSSRDVHRIINSPEFKKSMASRAAMQKKAVEKAALEKGGKVACKTVAVVGQVCKRQ